MNNTTHSNVVTLPKSNRKPSRHAVRKASRREQEATRQQAFGSAVLAFVAVALTVLSLTHLAHGIEVVTNCPGWEAWAMAVGVDLGFVALEIAKVTSRERTINKIGTHLNVAIIGTIVASSALNAMAFGFAATGWLVYPAVTLGLAIPAMVYVLTKCGTTMWLDR